MVRFRRDLRSGHRRHCRAIAESALLVLGMLCMVVLSDALRHHPEHLTSLRSAMACHALSGNIETAEKLRQQVALLVTSDRVSAIRGRVAFREQDIAKLEEAYRIAGVPE